MLKYGVGAALEPCASSLAYWSPVMLQRSAHLDSLAVPMCVWTPVIWACVVWEEAGNLLREAAICLSMPGWRVCVVCLLKWTRSEYLYVQPCSQWLVVLN